MKQLRLFAVVMTALLSLAAVTTAMARDMDPAVQVEWLEKNLDNPGLVVIDIRKVEDYKAGHIPGSVNVFYNIWAPGKGDLKNELPADDDLKDVLSSNGITPDSLVVVAGKNDTPSDRFDMSRVAMTLVYAGVSNASVLDGGFNRWTAEGKKTSTDVVKPRAKTYKGKFNKGIFIKKADFSKKIGSATIVDVREPAFFSGEKKLEFVVREGHIKGAVNLPAGSLLFKQDGTYRDKADLQAAAAKALGEDPAKEILLYCDTGKVASGWWLQLTQALGYTDVKVYDGSSQEWAGDQSLPMEK